MSWVSSQQTVKSNSLLEIKKRSLKGDIKYAPICICCEYRAREHLRKRVGEQTYVYVSSNVPLWKSMLINVKMAVIDWI